MIRLSLICHAATAATRRAAFASGEEPIEPGARGRAEAMARTIGCADQGRTGPATAARQTAEALALSATVEPALGDLDCGRWTGLAFDDVFAREPDAVAAWMADPAAVPHGGESVLALMGRVGGWLNERLGGSGRLVAVTHAAVVRAAIVHAIGADPRSFRHIDVGPLARAEFGADGRRWSLRALVPDLTRGSSAAG